MPFWRVFLCTRPPASNVQPQKLRELRVARLLRPELREAFQHATHAMTCASSVGGVGDEVPPDQSCVLACCRDDEATG